MSVMQTFTYCILTNKSLISWPKQTFKSEAWYFTLCPPNASLHATIAPMIFLFHFTLISLLWSCAWWRATLYISPSLSNHVCSKGHRKSERKPRGHAGINHLYPFLEQGIHWGRGTLLKREISFSHKQATVEWERQ